MTTRRFSPVTTSRAPALAAVGLALAAAVGMSLAARRQARESRAMDRVPERAWIWPAHIESDADAWSVFRAEDKATAASPEGWASRFRLAGSFFMYDGNDGAPSLRLAVIDDLEKGSQWMARPGDSLDGVRLVGVERNSATLEREGLRATLTLAFSSAPMSGPSASPASESSTDASPASGETAYGRRVGENRWVLQRDRLLKYYEEVMDEPERVVALFDSLEPIYDEGRITGYELNVRGEADFFKAMGLQPGDRVRQVNAMNMTSRNRGEYFIREFLENRLSVAVLDIEREGQPLKQVYLLR